MGIKLTNGYIINNLEGQVEYNKKNIEKHFEVDRVLANFGIKIIGRVDTPEDIAEQPVPVGGYQYGDAYAVGEEGTVYDYYIYTRPFEGETQDQWFDIGTLTIAGPQGPQGEKGDKGDTGASTKWIYAKYVANLPPATSETLNLGDLALVSSGDVLVLVESEGVRKWGYTNINIKGAQGLPGNKGDRGERGLQGIQGAQGIQGPRGLGIVILGRVQNVEVLSLISPDTVRRDGGYIVGQGSDASLYVITGGTPDDPDLHWENIGPYSSLITPYLPEGKLYKHNVLFDYKREEGVVFKCSATLYTTNPAPYTMDNLYEFWNDNLIINVNTSFWLSSESKMVLIQRVEYDPNHGFYRSYGLKFNPGSSPSYYNESAHVHYDQPIVSITDKVRVV